ncbi:MAG TPA: hypothetical protein VN452_02400 [Longilinea sp.]|nr:hypothetical protein [Longilinea sp.]
MAGPGKIALIGSGETAARGGQAFELLARHLPVPLNIAVMETPAGFELNASQVAGRVGEYMQKRLQNYKPHFQLVPARRRGVGGTDDWDILAPLIDSNLIFMGPGSPSYTVRQLQSSLAWDLIRARHRHGAALALASAATVAMGALSIPVYEIFKVGEDPYWKPGLDLLGDFGLHCVIVPHWNNTEGGQDVDTGRCFIGRQRFEYLQEQLPAKMVVIGIDEHSGMIIDLVNRSCRVTGRDGVHILNGQDELHFCSGDVFPVDLLGEYQLPENLEDGIDSTVWEKISGFSFHSSGEAEEVKVPEQIAALVAQREQARNRKDWSASDHIRAQAAELGWKIIDTPDGQQAMPG